MKYCKTFFLAIIFLGINFSNADVPAPYLINLSTNDIATKLFRISHRFEGRVSDETLQRFGGLDNGALIRLAFDGALSENTSASISRTSWTGNYETMYKHRFYNPKGSSVSYSLGANIQGGADELKELSGDSYNGQVTYQKDIEAHTLISTILYSSSTNPIDKESTIAVGFGSRYHLANSHYFLAEVIKPVDGYIGDNNYPLTSLAWDWQRGLHNFQLVLTNSGQLNFNKYVTTEGILDARDFYLGFSISRQFF